MPVADGPPLLVVVDYPGRRDAARVADLRPRSIGFDVTYLLDPVFPREVDGRAYAARLLADLDPRRPVAGVLGYCMAAPIAQEVAALLSTDRDPVPLVLFDARPATPAAVAHQYREAARQLAGQLGGGVAVPELDPGLVTSSPAAAVATMRAELVRLGVAASPDEDEHEAAAIAAGLADHFLDWLVHLVAAHHCTWPAWGGRVLHVMSTAHTHTDDWPGATSTELARVDVPRLELLRTGTVGRLVRTWLAPIPNAEERT